MQIKVSVRRKRGRVMRDCDNCARCGRDGCKSWDCDFVPRKEAIEAWKEKHATADRKTENSSEIPNNCEEPQYEMGMGTLRCDNCSEYGSFKCTKCDGEMYFTRLEPKDEPQTERSE